MSETLIIAGVTFESVAGFKAVDSSLVAQTYIKPEGMAQISISSNGITTEDITAYASAQISVAVPNTYAAADEGKVVSSGELVVQGSATYSSNGTYNTTLINSVEVNVSSGDTNPVAEDNDIVFIDYDGTIRYSYTASDFAALSSLPPNPSHEGLTAQGWNWTLTDAKTYVESFGKLVIGQSYVTTNGKTKLYMIIPSDSLWAEVRVKPTVSNGVVIDWGDGDTTTTNRTSIYTYHHDYSTNGHYIIQITVNSGTAQLVGDTPWAAMTGSTYVDNRIRNRNKLQKVEFGSGITSFGTYMCNNQGALKTITIPTTVTLMDGQVCFGNCHSLQAVVFPKDFVFNDNVNGDFNSCRALQYVSFPKDIVNTAKTLRKNSFNNCENLKRFDMPSNLTTIGDSCFYATYTISKIIIPSGVTSIGSGVFGGTYLTEIHMRPTTPPALSNKNAFNSLLSTGIIYVPYSEDHSILNLYQTASNWVDWASYMQEEPR